MEKEIVNIRLIDCRLYNLELHLNNTAQMTQSSSELSPFLCKSTSGYTKIVINDFPSYAWVHFYFNPLNCAFRVYLKLIIVISVGTDSLSSAREAEMRTSWPSRYSVVMRSLHCTSSPSGPPLKAFSAILKPDSFVRRPKCTRIWWKRKKYGIQLLTPAKFALNF